MTRNDGPPLHLWDVRIKATPVPADNRAVRAADRIFRPTTRSDEAVAWLNDVHDLAERAGFAVPRHVPSVNGRLVEDGWTCEMALSGRPFAPTELPQIRTRIAVFHDLTRRVPQRPDFLSSQSLLKWSRGGDIDLDAMPPEVAAACRAAWEPLVNQPLTVVHGDLSPKTLVRCADGRPGLLGWDESRRDVALFDRAEAEQPRLAWQVAARWTREPTRARRLASRLTG
ncbi:hypothetical protein SAMN04488020_105233 [Palleronia marisminoris]|uniref:Phosphotransferase enzyme family protein n=1 Tax=Palleronia marisminoris TaxID=315423 RepID=A0A1Y5SYS9_9RHOB|nr:hypothetical protein [Palleronia marisminoris]SFG98867.1 hypothetical protein SAMN04488020_105233 [Palleronia marisminoris]SLN48241.1 hypothetical protein PAM7066_02177 [Palleronia marisminoris]